jgi:hypothetical protein
MYTQKVLLGATVGLVASPLASAESQKRQVACTSAAIPHPTLFGAEILDVSVAEYRDQTILSSFGGFPANLTVSYCGVNVYVTMFSTSQILAYAATAHIHTRDGTIPSMSRSGYLWTAGTGKSHIHLP